MKYRCPIHIFMKPSKQYDMLFMDVYKYIHTHCLMGNEWLSLSREGKKQNSRLEGTLANYIIILRD